MKTTLTNITAQCLPVAAATVFIYCTVYFVMQQYIRLSANELPAQYATDVLLRLQQGVQPATALQDIAHTDMKKSLAPFVIIYDAQGTPLAGTTTLNGLYPAPLISVLTHAKSTGESRITWRPQHNVRVATVIMPYSVNMPASEGRSGYILAGRSLKETEDRKQFMLMQLFAGTIITLIATFAATVIKMRVLRPITNTT